MSEKVKLPREVAEAIEEFRRCEETTADIIIAIFNGADSMAAYNLRKFSKDDGRFEDLLKALVNGFEAEQTPEDKVREYYQKAKSDMESTDYDLSFPGRERVEAISYILEALNIKIEGVNA